jgi:hypothetical protein
MTWASRWLAGRSQAGMQSAQQIKPTGCIPGLAAGAAKSRALSRCFVCAVIEWQPLPRLHINKTNDQSRDGRAWLFFFALSPRHQHATIHMCRFVAFKTWKAIWDEFNNRNHAPRLDIVLPFYVSLILHQWVIKSQHVLFDDFDAIQFVSQSASMPIGMNGELIEI